MLHINIDLSALADLLNVKSAAKKVARDAAKQLSTAIHGKMVQLAGERLKSRRQMFVENLSMYEEEGVWIVSLAGKARWIDDGMKPHSMLDALLSSPKAKTSKDGSKYIVVPFNHGPGKGKTNTTPAQHDLIATLKSEMKKRDIGFGKVEKHPDGSPKLGRLHAFDIGKKPLKTGTGPWQGKGAIGDVRQGPTGIPFLQSVNVYQHKDKETGKVRRSITTFRVASDKHRGQGRWDYPQLEKTDIMADAVRWAKEEWSSKIEPEIMKALKVELK